MPTESLLLAQARVLLCNDDGIEANGLSVLETVVRRLVKEVWTVAPETEQSAASHSLTMRRPLFVRRLSRRRFAVDGTPTDCVLLAVHRLLGSRMPDLVLSGVNQGANLGEDVSYSGTVAAAKEGALLGIPSVAFSQLCNADEPVHWATAAAWISPVLERVARLGRRPGLLFNVNFPDRPPSSVTGIEITRQGRHKIGGDLIEGTDPRGRPYFWIGRGRDEDRTRTGSDLEAVHRGAVSITPLSLDQTDEATRQELDGRQALGEAGP